MLGEVRAGDGSGEVVVDPHRTTLRILIEPRGHVDRLPPHLRIAREPVEGVVRHRHHVERVPELQRRLQLSVSDATTSTARRCRRRGLHEAIQRPDDLRAVVELERPGARLAATLPKVSRTCDGIGVEDAVHVEEQSRVASCRLGRARSTHPPRLPAAPASGL